MKKKLAIFFVVILCVCAILVFAACNGNSDNSGNSGSNGNDSGISNDNGSSDNDSDNSSTLPTSAEIVEARSNSVSQSIQAYDFNLTFSGNFSVLGIGTSLNGIYDGAYRYDGESDEITFKRTTSGALLADSTCYMFTAGNNQIKATMDKNAVKKISVELPEEQDITMINLPVVKIVNSVDKNNISNINKSSYNDYDYSCKLSAGNSTLVYSALSKVFEKLGTGVSFKGITFTENTSTLDFNIKDGKLDDFRLAFKLQISVKLAKVVVDVVYSQKANSTAISLPNISDFLYRTADVQTEVNTIYSAIEDLKDDAVYSLDLVASNELDPGWNKTAVVDKYNSRMYKNTIDDVAWFNHSYVYKAHSETAGKESYKYTLGNVNGSDEHNQGTWLISRKSSNTQTQIQGVTADTQFDFLTAMVKQQASEIDCVKKQTVGATTTYTLYLGKTATQNVQKKIIDMINTNEYDDVIAVDNYYNTENVIKDASIQIIITNGKISSIVCDTEICYTPTGGEYTEYNVTLNNTIEMQVNANYDKALAYEPPTKVKGTLGWGKNLNDAEYYIL
ncbi:MAG: hypothetical protein K2J89_00725 [Clostridia bacterium]|nr:hypothetical protein [Clostridia bacterium]